MRPFPLAFLSALLLSSAARAQCSFDWASGYNWPYRTNELASFAVFDDHQGSGPALFAGGSLIVGNVSAFGIARWNGAHWNALGSSLDWINPNNNNPTRADALAVWDDGSGAALYVGGSFEIAGGQSARHIARWDGTSFTPLAGGITVGAYGLTARVFALASFDDGSGDALYAGGQFTEVDGIPVNFIARWNGASWSSVGSGVDGIVHALIVHDDGSGAALYAGGSFLTAGGNTVDNLARWNGTSWSAVGGGLGNSVLALAIYDDGAGPKLYAGGDFESAGGVQANRVARWDGSNWSRLDAGMNSSVLTLRAHALGGTSVLVAGGAFTTADNQPAARLASWNGDRWSAIGAGASATVSALALFDENQGGGPALFAGGNFDTIGGLFSPRIGRWQPSGWSAVDVGNGFNSQLMVLREADDGSGNGPQLFAGGDFTRAGATNSARIAKWSGNAWVPLGSGVSGTPGTSIPAVLALAEFDDGAGPALYAGGYFSTAGGVAATKCIARWRNGAWSSIGGMNGTNGVCEVDALAVFDDGSGPALYVGGQFTSAGGVATSNIARWNGTSWSAMPGLGSNSNRVYTLASWDDGNGTKLYAGGDFGVGGINQPDGIVRWDGTSWSSIGSTGGGTVRALLAHDDGNGSRLYLAGSFYYASGQPQAPIVRWDGASFSSVGTPWTGQGYALGSFDEGSGSELYFGGSFNALGGAPAPNLARWNGASWSGVGGGISYLVRTLQGSGGTLYAGGLFGAAGSVPSNGIAAWREVCDWVSTCSGDGTSGPCPCGNSGASGRGCANSVDPNGALLSASGATTPDSLVLTTNGSPASALTIFFKGNATIAPAVFGDGLRCAGGQLVRFGARNAVNGSASYPGPGETPISVLGATPPGSGLSAVVQAFFRDPAAGFCTSATFNGTNALRVVW